MTAKALINRPLRVSVIASVILFAFTVVTTHAAEKRSVTVEDILTMKRVSDPQISTDGSRIAYVVTEASLEKNVNDSDIWVVGTGGGEPVRLTRGPEKDDTPRWSHDGTKVAFLSDREDKNQIFVIRMSGGEAGQLTDHKTGVGSFEWAPDDNSIAYLAEVPLSEEEEEKRKESPIVVDTDYRFQQLWRINVETKDVSRIVDKNIHVSEIAWSPDGKTFALAARPTPRLKDFKYSDIYLVPADGGELHEIPSGPMPRSGPRFLPDGNLVYQSRDGLGAFNTKLYLADARGDNSKVIAGQHDENAAFLGASEDGRLIFFRSRAKTMSDVYSVPAAGGKPQRVTKGNMVLAGVSMSRDTKTLAFVGHSSTMPPDVYTSSVEPFEPEKLTTINPQAEQFSLGEQQVISWKSVDGLEIEGVLIKPVGYEPGRKYPLLLLIHGGPSGVWSNGFNIRNSAYPTQVFAGQGYAIIMPNPRGSGGYGEQHRRGNFQDLSGKEWDDCSTGVDAVIKMGIGDPDRIGIMGWSYGGHLTYWGITQTDRFKAGSAGAGANNLISMYSQTDLPGFYSDTYFGFPPWKKADFYWERSSLSQVAKVKTPLLIQVGENDRRVPKTQSIEYYTALKDLGVPTELVIYPRQPHGVREPKLVLDLLQRNVDWFKKWVLEGGHQSTNP